MIATHSRNSRTASAATPRERRRLVGRAARSAGRFALQPLEPRTLMSVTFATVDSFQLALGKSSQAEAVAADAAGNIYAAGSAADSTGASHFVIREKAAGSAAWTVIFDALGGSDWASLVVDPAGDLYAGNGQFGPSGSTWTIYERPAGQSTFAVVDHIVGAQDPILATDAAGDIYVSGYVSNHMITRKQTGGIGVFTTVDDFIGNFTRAEGEGVTVVDGTGPSAGVYTIAQTLNLVSGNNDWLVRKSADGGATWSTVDDFANTTKGSGSYIPWGIGHDANGNVYVVGQGFEQIITGYKGKTPIYADSVHWITRKSTDGGASWTTSDDFTLSSAPSSSVAYGITSNLLGNMYVVGEADANGVESSIVRTNAGGTWQTVDNFPSALGYGITVDSLGNIYTASNEMPPTYAPTWIIREAAVPQANDITPTLQVAAPNAVYNAHAYSSASATVLAAADTAAVSFTYYAAGDALLANPIAAPVNAGSYQVVAHVAASPGYTAADSAPVTFTITKAVLSGIATTQDSLNITKLQSLAITINSVAGLQGSDTLASVLSSALFSLTIGANTYTFAPTVTSNATSIHVTYTLQPGSASANELRADPLALDAADGTVSTSPTNTPYSTLWITAISQNYTLTDDFLTRLYSAK